MSLPLGTTKYVIVAPDGRVAPVLHDTERGAWELLRPGQPGAQEEMRAAGYQAMAVRLLPVPPPPPEVQGAIGHADRVDPRGDGW